MSAFLQRKLDTFFTRLDVDQNGAITASDFEILATVLIQTETLDEKRGAELKCKLAEVFDKFFKASAASKESFREAIKKSIASKEFAKWAEGVFKIFFYAVDINGDGVLQKSEFVLVFTTLFKDAEMAETAFKAADTNKDGVLSLEEYTAAGKSFLTCEDESNQSKFFWGPLV